MTREPNPSIVILITSLSLATYIFFPAIFFDLASKAIMLIWIRVTGETSKKMNDTNLYRSIIGVLCSFFLCIYWSNMNLRTFKRISKMALVLLSALLVVFVSQAVRFSVN